MNRTTLTVMPPSLPTATCVRSVHGSLPSPARQIDDSASSSSNGTATGVDHNGRERPAPADAGLPGADETCRSLHGTPSDKTPAALYDPCRSRAFRCRYLHRGVAPRRCRDCRSAPAVWVVSHPVRRARGCGQPHHSPHSSLPGLRQTSPEGTWRGSCTAKASQIARCVAQMGTPPPSRRGNRDERCPMVLSGNLRRRAR